MNKSCKKSDIIHVSEKSILFLIRNPERKGARADGPITDDARG